MHHNRLSFFSIALLAACGSTSGVIPLQITPSAPETISLTSADFDADRSLPQTHAGDRFGCTGDNLAPRLAWTGAPSGTASYALVVHDPDAPTGVGFFHWVVTDIPGDATTIENGALPAGARVHHTDYGATGYGGPCPPEGDPAHRYVFSLYALDTPSLGLPEGATGALVRFALAEHTLAYGTLVGTYGR